MIDDKDLFDHFRAQPKPNLRPFLASRVIAHTRTKPSRLTVTLIWGFVLLLCGIAAVAVHIPSTPVLIALVVISPLVFRPSRRAGARRFVSVLFSGPQ